jgi:hypothetical protein
MKNLRTHVLLAAALVAAAAAGLATQHASAKEPAPEVPAAIAVPAGHKLFLTTRAAGVQIYVCAATPTGHLWSLVAPRANLYNEHGKLLGTHFAGPTWQANDGSSVVGRVVDRVPQTGTIPWLLLEIASHGGPEEGRFARTAYIQRLATTGGVAPTEGCGAATAGTIAEVPYTADYAFWKQKGGS